MSFFLLKLHCLLSITEFNGEQTKVLRTTWHWIFPTVFHSQESGDSFE
jgi:hypothetical protein